MQLVGFNFRTPTTVAVPDPIDSRAVYVRIADDVTPLAGPDIQTHDDANVPLLGGAVTAARSRAWTRAGWELVAVRYEFDSTEHAQRYLTLREKGI